MSDEIAVGKETLAYCTSCRLDLAHTITAMKGDRILKVECKTCKKTHAYKKAKGVTEVAKKKTRSRSKKEEEPATLENEWQKLMDAHKDAPTRSYDMKANFLLGDKLNHNKFGEGIVGKLIYPNKIEVVFRGDIKVLIHGGTPPAA